MTEAQSKKRPYDPDFHFKGFNASLDVNLGSYFAMKYEHLSGFEHDVYTGPTVMAEWGLSVRYHFNKNWSLRIGGYMGSVRLLKWTAVYREAKFFFDYTDDEELLNRIITAGLGDGMWSRMGFQFNYSVPVSVAYHQYMARNNRHRLDYELGIAYRTTTSDTARHLGTNVLSLTSNNYVGWEQYSFGYHTQRRRSAELQLSFGYTFVLKNNQAMSFSLLSNVSLMKDPITGNASMLYDSPYHETGRFTATNHYMALRYAYIFKTITARKRRKER